MLDIGARRARPAAPASASRTSRRSSRIRPTSASSRSRRRCRPGMTIERIARAHAHRPLVPRASSRTSSRVGASARGARRAGAMPRELLRAREAARASRTAQIARARAGIGRGAVRDERAGARASAPSSSRSTRSRRSTPRRPTTSTCTYNGTEDDVAPRARGARCIVLGSGAYRIGSSVEFDWCCVERACSAARELGSATIMVNCNPETVSTDYDECDRLYFEELTLETRARHLRARAARGRDRLGGRPDAEQPRAEARTRAGVRILGTRRRRIDRAEDRHKFSQLLDELGIDQPPWRELLDARGGRRRFAEQVGYPVLSGRRTSSPARP